MVSVGVLYTNEPEPHVYFQTIRATAAIAGFTVDTIPVSGITSETPEYKAKFASGKLPGFETRDGFTLFRGSAIARYIASLAPSSGLLGTSPTDAALVDQWVSYFESEILSGEDTFWAFLADEVLYNQLHETVLRERLHEHLVVVNTHLTHNTFFLPTNRISLADITGAAVIMDIFRFYLGPADRAKYPALVRLLETVANHPEIKAIFGSLRFMDFPAVFVSPSQEESSPEPGAKNPLDDLPRSTFKLRDWKRAYSNMDTRGAGGSLEWFYGKFDPEGFSIWRVDFKYNEELTQTFMSSNQIGGFFNRLEASKKYAFGSVGVLGEPNSSRISGIFIVRGNSYKPVLDVAPEWDSYKYKQIDLSNPEDKAFFEAALAWDLEVDGKKWMDGKSFK
ncbi:unnamed protein product [Rhizoctonia solani]|uniref:Elongation factor 1-gamma n=1 Tax=Rhizoctonia solani TaxID=456999 RepID=A0A8H2W8Y5_9AGAM|nr:unnamed protein product [Rhizoctonia solani]